MTHLFGKSLILVSIFALSSLITSGCAHTELASEDVVGASDPQKELTAENLFGASDEKDLGTLSNLPLEEGAKVASNETPTEEMPRVEESALPAVEQTGSVEGAPVANNNVVPIEPNGIGTQNPAGAVTQKLKARAKKSPLNLDTQKPRTDNGTLLNRYYFVRSGDTPVKVSELLYGDSAKEKDLVAWNPGDWETGKVVWYNSPIDPADGKVASFYSERAIKAEEYVVKEGDKLSTIAGEKYGDVATAKEIAAINHMRPGAALMTGQILALMPTKLDTLVKRELAALPAAIVAKADAPAKLAGPVDDEGYPMSTAPKDAKAAPELASAEVGRVAEGKHVATLLAVLGGACMLFAFFYYRRLRRAKTYSDVIE